jgi:phosphohistidine phosphatase
MHAYLVHHADAVPSLIDPQRPLSERGREHAEQLAAEARAAGVAPAAIWHSGKARARQTAECFYRICSPFAEFKMVRGLGPDDPPEWIADALSGETRDVMLVGHIPNLSALLELLAPASAPFPLHGLVALEWRNGWAELWRL